MAILTLYSIQLQCFHISYNKNGISRMFLFWLNLEVIQQSQLLRSSQCYSSRFPQSHYPNHHISILNILNKFPLNPNQQVHEPQLLDSQHDIHSQQLLIAALSPISYYLPSTPWSLLSTSTLQNRVLQLNKTKNILNFAGWSPEFILLQNYGKNKIHFNIQLTYTKICPTV